MRLDLDWVDAFAARPFAGNGCAVVYDGGALDDDTCRAVVRETGLVECTFVAPSDVADARVRYFLAEREIPFAGHPTVATAASLLDRGRLREGKASFETGAGVVPLSVSRDGAGLPRVTMTQAAPVFGPEVPVELVAAVGGVDPGDIVGTPRLMSTGLPTCVTVVASHDVLGSVRLDVAALERFRAACPPDWRGAIEPFWVTLGGATEAGATFARLLMAPPNPPEDPFTGSATGAMAAYLWRNGLVYAPAFVAEQGHWMGRPGQAEVERVGTADTIEGVRVSGTGYVLIRGTIEV